MLKSKHLIIGLVNAVANYRQICCSFVSAPSARLVIHAKPEDVSNLHISGSTPGVYMRSGQNCQHVLAMPEKFGKVFFEYFAQVYSGKFLVKLNPFRTPETNGIINQGAFRTKG